MGRFETCLSAEPYPRGGARFGPGGADPLRRLLHGGRADPAGCRAERQHGRRHDLAGRRPLPPAAERAFPRGLLAQRAAPARGRQRLPHGRPAGLGHGSRLAGRRRVARRLQVLRRRPLLAELPAARAIRRTSRRPDSRRRSRPTTRPRTRRCGPARRGLLYYSGIAFNRGTNNGGVFVVDLLRHEPEGKRRRRWRAAIRCSTSARSSWTRARPASFWTRPGSPWTFRAPAAAAACSRASPARRRSWRATCTSCGAASRARRARRSCSPVRSTAGRPGRARSSSPSRARSTRGRTSRSTRPAAACTRPGASSRPRAIRSRSSSPGPTTSARRSRPRTRFRSRRSPRSTRR